MAFDEGGGRWDGNRRLIEGFLEGGDKVAC